MWYLIFLAYKYNVQSGKNHCGHAYNSQVQEIIHLNKCKKERLFMEERDDLEQMAFIQKWNDGKAEREKKREQMWNGILEKAGIKKEEKKKRKMIFRKNEKNSNRNSKFKFLFEFFI